LKRPRPRKREEAEVRKRGLIGAGAAAVAAAAALSGIAIAGGGEDRELDRVVVAEPITATEPGPKLRGAGGSTIQTFYLQEPVNPPENSGSVVGPRCPTGTGGAIGGGASTQPGIVISYLSQIRPGANPATGARTYYVGVDDNSTTNNANASAVIEVHCAKGIAVRK
jgi:hypothetical protein